MEQGSCNFILNEAYQTCKLENHPWYQATKKILYKNGMGNVWENPHFTTTKSLGKQLKQRLNDQHIQNYTHLMQQNRAFCYCIPNAGDGYCMKKYLLDITNIETRNILTRLRLDKNILNSCQGKYKKVNFDQRYCPFCPAGTIETVDHFIATCPKYTQTREIYISKLISLTSSNHINDRKLIQITMNADPMSKNTEKHKILACISHYIKSSYTVRLNHAKAENPS